MAGVNMGKVNTSCCLLGIGAVFGGLTAAHYFRLNGRACIPWQNFAKVGVVFSITLAVSAIAMGILGHSKPQLNDENSTILIRTFAAITSAVMATTAIAKCFKWAPSTLEGFGMAGLANTAFFALLFSSVGAHQLYKALFPSCSST